MDIVLNSLAGEAIPRGLSQVLRNCGHFLKLGKHNICQNIGPGLGLLPFQRSSWPSSPSTWGTASGP